VSSSCISLIPQSSSWWLGCKSERDFFVAGREAGDLCLLVGEAEHAVSPVGKGGRLRRPGVLEWVAVAGADLRLVQSASFFLTDPRRVSAVARLEMFWRRKMY
jgi:hypothetical protein